MNCAVEDNGSVRTLGLSGDLTVQCADELHGLLSEAIRESDHVEIDLSGVESADIPCLQLLCAAHKTAHRQNKVFRSKGPWSEAFTDAARDAAYLRQRCCGLSTGKDCMWIIKGGPDE